MIKTYVPPVVPTELQPLLTDEVIAIHEKFQGMEEGEFDQTYRFAETRADIGEKAVKACIVGLGNDPEAGIRVLALPHQQSFKRSHQIRSALYHEINNPEGVTIVLPNNSTEDKAYQFTSEERKEIKTHGLRTFYEQQLRTIEYFLRNYRSIGKVMIDGYSLGGLTSIGIASVGSKMFGVDTVHSVEAPNRERTTKELQKAFLSSGGFGDVRKAVEDAKIPIASKPFTKPRLLMDFARFGISTLDPDNKALVEGMARPDFLGLVGSNISNNPNTSLVIGRVAGSKLFDSRVIDFLPGIEITEYSEGEGNHMHATGDNILAHALMMAA